MRFTKGLFLGTAIGITTAMMMNNKSRNNNTQNKNSSGKSSQTEVQSADDYLVNDII